MHASVYPEIDIIPAYPPSTASRAIHTVVTTQSNEASSVHENTAVVSKVAILTIYSCIYLFIYRVLPPLRR